MQEHNRHLARIAYLRDFLIYKKDNAWHCSRECLFDNPYYKVEYSQWRHLEYTSKPYGIYDFLHILDHLEMVPTVVGSSQHLVHPFAKPVKLSRLLPRRMKQILVQLGQDKEIDIGKRAYSASLAQILAAGSIDLPTRVISMDVDEYYYFMKTGYFLPKTSNYQVLLNIHWTSQEKMRSYVCEKYDIPDPKFSALHSVLTSGNTTSERIMTRVRVHNDWWSDYTVPRMIQFSEERNIDPEKIYYIAVAYSEMNTNSRHEESSISLPRTLAK